jgi:hypothetical protein
MIQVPPEQLKEWIAHLESARGRVIQDAWDLHVSKVLAEMRAAIKKGEGG